MENRSVRKGEWIAASGVQIGPGNYDVTNFKLKESFNYGQIPFGSLPSKQQFDKSRQIN